MSLLVSLRRRIDLSHRGNVTLAGPKQVKVFFRHTGISIRLGKFREKVVAATYGLV